MTAAQTEELQGVCDHHKKAYMRERAAAILKVAIGLSMLQVALRGLLKPMRSDTISQWISRYEGGGVQGLQVQAPQDLELAVADLTETVHQSPECFGLSRSRWWLEGLRQSVPWLSSLSLPGICQLLDRLHIAYKRGRRYMHSPDPDYPIKSVRLRSAWQEVLKNPTRFVLLYQDELTYYRFPTVFCDYATAGSDAPLAAQGTSYNTSRRIAGCLDAYTGRLITGPRSAFDHQTALSASGGSAL